MTIYCFQKWTKSSLRQPVSNPCKPLSDGVSFNNSKTLSVPLDDIFGGGPPLVFLCFLPNFDSSFFAVLWRFVLFSFTSLTLQCAVRCAVPTAFTAIANSSHTLCFILLVFVLVNFDFSTAWFSSNFWVIIAISCAEKFGFRFLQAVLTISTSLDCSLMIPVTSSSSKEFLSAILVLKVDTTL